MASTSYAALVAEVERVTSSPYPSQLRTLRDIVVSQCTDAEISQWVAAKPCLVESLATCLIEGLQQWSYVLDIITMFAFDAACRDAFLQQEPTLLHSVVSHAVKTGDPRSKYAKASIALLSLPLPNTVALPAEVQTLFVQLVEEAAKRPCVVTIEPIYLLLSGTGNLLLGILSTEVLTRFEEQLIEILRNSTGAPDHCISLYCLSIMNVVCCSIDPDFRLTASSYNTQDFLASTPTSSRWKSEAMQQFFTGSKAQRSMQLIVALVLWATNRSSSGEPSDEKIRCLVLVNEVITAIPPDLRKNWCTANTITIRKLQEKLCAENQDETARTLALRFMGKLCELDSLPHPTLEGIELTFLEPRSVQIAYTLCPRVDDSELFSSVLARAPISVLLQNAIDFAIRQDGSELSSGLQSVTRTVESAATIIEEQKITGHEIRATLNDATFVQSLQRLLDILKNSSPQPLETACVGWCSKALHRTRSNLAHQICNLLLRACHSSSMSAQCMTLLLSLYACSARGNLRCLHEKQTWSEHARIAETNDHSMEEVVDWREALHTHFEVRAHVEQDAVTRLFTKACASLEARCENVEEPLRKEREMRQKAEEHNTALTQAFAEMEARNIDLSIQLRRLEEERIENVRDIEERGDENSSLLERVAQLEQKLREALSEGERRLTEMKSAKQIAELEGASTVARKQEELDDMREQLDEARRTSTSKTQELRSDLADARSECERLGESLASHDTRAKELQNRVDVLERNNEEFHEINSRLQAELDTAGNDLASKTDQNSDLRSQLEDATSECERLRESLTRQIEEVQRDLEAKVAAAQQALEEMAVSDSGLKHNVEQLQNEVHEHQTTLDSKETKITDLKKKIERLQAKCEQKDQQIAEAEAMRSNLMAAMGLQGHAKLAHRSRESMTQPDDPTPPTPTSGDGMEADTQDTNISLEPTPKRPRPRKSIATTARAKSLGTTAQTQPVTRRQTLGVVSGNTRQSMRPVSFKTPLKEAIAEHPDDESTFEGSELFTGTQGARMVDLQAAYDEGEL